MRILKLLYKRFSHTKRLMTCIALVFSFNLFANDYVNYDLRELLAISIGKSEPIGISFERRNPPKESTLNIGLIVPFSIEPELSAELIMGAELAVEKINQLGGINGKKLVLVRGDSNANIEISKSVAKELIEKYHINALIGPIYSEFVEPVAKSVTLPAKIPMVLPTATATGISHIKDSDLIFRIAPNNHQITKTIDQFLLSKKKQRVAVFYQSDRFGNDLLNLLMESTKNAPYEIVYSKSVHREVNYALYSLRPEIADLKKAKVDAIYLPLTDETVQWNILNQLIPQMYDPLPTIILPEQQTYRQEHAKPITDRNLCVYSVVIKVDSIREEAINKKISNFLKTQSKHYYAALMYDSIFLVASALHHQNLNDESFSQAIRSVSDENGKLIDIKDFQLLKEQSIQKKNTKLQGIIGPMILDKNGDNKGISLSTKGFHTDFGAGCRD